MISTAESPYFDVIIVGAGLSGIAAAYYLRSRCPGRSFAILEARDAMGGTWDLFRYPGIRSDSDLYTFGFSFAPWREEKSIADGPSILGYLKETAAQFGIDKKIRFNEKVTRASWDSGQARWSVEVSTTVGQAAYRCGFLYLCTGYYDFADGYLPRWPGTEAFKGTLVHPQHWPGDLNYAGRKVLVIGSGATAVTLVPALARTAAHVAMLQRSPSYILALPARDRVANWFRRNFPASTAHTLSRWKNIFLTMIFYNLARTRPEGTKRMILGLAKKQLAADFDSGRHLSPRYNPWDQRLCLAPDGDLFKALRSGKASIVTDDIASFTAGGVRTNSGEEINVDIVVAATGLQFKLLGGIDIVLDGRQPDLTKSLIYRGMMLSGVPNLAFSMGYTNASWTLKCELIARYVCRVLNHMQRSGKAIATPQVRGVHATEPAIGLTSGYVLRALPSLPKQGSKRPWKLYQNYLLDLLTLRFGRIEDGSLEFKARCARPLSGTSHSS